MVAIPLKPVKNFLFGEDSNRLEKKVVRPSPVNLPFSSQDNGNQEDPQKQMEKSKWKTRSIQKSLRLRFKKASKIKKTGGGSL